MSRENGELSPISQEVLGHGFRNGFEQMKEAQLIAQTAPNAHVQVYRIALPEGDMFTKVYLNTPEVADKEYEHYRIFEDLPFVPSLRFRLSTEQKRLLAYNFVEGDNLHHQLTVLRAASRYPDQGVIMQAFDQIRAMGEVVALSPDVATSPDRSWPTRSPIRAGFLSAEDEQVFLSDYQVVRKRNVEAIKDFPGYYLDRNPRNLMQNRNGIVQVDFGVIEQSSPLFDAAKLLRNGTDVRLPDNTDLDESTDQEDILSKLSILAPEQEASYLDYLYKLHFPDAGEDPAKWEHFKHLYLFAATHSHIFYITKYAKMLREEMGDKDKLFSRMFYHLGMAHYTLRELEARGEQVKPLIGWLDQFRKSV